MAGSTERLGHGGVTSLTDTRGGCVSSHELEVDQRNIAVLNRILFLVHTRKCHSGLIKHILECIEHAIVAREDPGAKSNTRLLASHVGVGDSQMPL